MTANPRSGLVRLSPALPSYGVGEGLGEACSEGGTLDGFGTSGEVCRLMAFHAVPNRLKTSVIRPDAVSGAPL